VDELEIANEALVFMNTLCEPGMVIRPFRHTLEINGKLGHIQVLLSSV
jgi:hypothetical protein